MSDDNQIDHLNKIEKLRDDNEKIDEYLNSAEAMIRIISVSPLEELLEIDTRIIPDYLYALCNFITRAKNINKRALDALLEA